MRNRMVADQTSSSGSNHQSVLSYQQDEPNIGNEFLAKILVNNRSIVSQLSTSSLSSTKRNAYTRTFNETHHMGLGSVGKHVTSYS